MLDDIHGRRGEARTVRQNANISTELNEASRPASAPRLSSAVIGSGPRRPWRLLAGGRQPRRRAQICSRARPRRHRPAAPMGLSRGARRRALDRPHRAGREFVTMLASAEPRPRPLSMPAISAASACHQYEQRRGWRRASPAAISSMSMPPSVENRISGLAPRRHEERQHRISRAMRACCSTSRRSTLVAADSHAEDLFGGVSRFLGCAQL